MTKKDLMKILEPLSDDTEVVVFDDMGRPCKMYESNFYVQGYREEYGRCHTKDPKCDKIYLEVSTPHVWRVPEDD